MLCNDEKSALKSKTALTPGVQKLSSRINAGSGSVGTAIFILFSLILLAFSLYLSTRDSVVDSLR